MLIVFIFIALFKQAPFQFFTDIKNSIKEVKKEQKVLEDEIDKMVYELYGLSEEEVRVVEESLK